MKSERGFIDLRGAALALCLLWAAQAWGDSTGQLVILSTPPGATITIDGVRAGRAPLTKPRLLPGDHAIDANWPDGSSANTIAHVNAGASAVIKIGVPEVETGQLVIATTPPGAAVSVDGKAQKGATPMTVRELGVGPHVLVANFPDGRTATITANVGAHQSAVVRLEAPAHTTGTLIVMSEPAGAQILVDGQRRGAAVLALHDVAVGAHQLAAEWPDGRTQKEAVTVAGGVSTAARLLAPAPPTGELVITTTPSGAQLELDGKLQPTPSPLTVHQLAVGGHVIVAIWPDGRTLRATATVVRDGAVGAHLQPPAALWGHLEIASEPAGARIVLDGAAQAGMAPMTLHQIADGAHIIVAQWPDGRTTTTTATVATSATTRARLVAPPLPAAASNQ